MAKKKIETNVFALYFQLKTNLDSIMEMTSYTQVVQAGKRFMLEFEKYLKKADWTKNEIVKDIIKYSLRGLSANQIKDKLGISENSYRVHIYRITDKVYSVIFGGKSCPEALLYFNDLDVINSYISKIRLLTHPYNPYSELPIEIMKMIEKKTDSIPEIEVPDRDSISDADYFTALNFISLYSSQTVKARLDIIKPEVLKFVLNDLEKDSAGESVIYLDILSRVTSKPRLGVAESTISQMKAEFRKVIGD